jgi:predicted nucleic acid-binding protein
MWVFDATPLIYLAKVDRFGLVDEIEGRSVVPEPVHAEVVEVGIEAGYPDARRIEAGIEDGIADIVPIADTPLRSRLRENPKLSEADAAVLACADARDGTAVMDETYGRDVASTEGIATRGTAYLVLSLAADGAVSADEARSVIDAMVDEGWYCSTDTYATILSKLESMGD